MAIEIIDGFKLSTAVPVDSRIVASGSIARSAIPYKYEGLRVFDTSDSIAYVWMNNNWASENKSSLSIPSNITPNFTSGSGYKAGQVLKVLNTNNQLTNSNILEVEYLDVNNNITSKTVAINHASVSSVNNPFDSQIKLDVNGTIKANSFIGIGSNLTSLDATKITIGKLNPTTQLLPGTSDYVLRTNSAGTGVEWVPASSLSSGVGISSAATSGSTSLLTHYLTFVEDGITTASGLKVYRESGQPIGVIPQNGQIVVKETSAPSSPPYSFKGDVNTGIYRSGPGQVSISSSGNQRFEVNSNSVRVPSGTDATSLGLRFGGSGTSFTQNNNGFYYAFASSISRIGIVANGDEVVRVMSNTTGGQGSGSVNIYGNGGTLSLYGAATTYIQFYKNGATNPNTPSTRSGYIGFESPTVNNFSINNESTGSSIKLISTGEIALNAQSTIMPSFTSIKSNSSSFAATIQNSNAAGSGLKIDIGTVTKLAVNNTGLAVGGGSSIRRIVTGTFNMTKGSTWTPTKYGTGYSLTFHANYGIVPPGTSWGQVIKVNIDGGVPAAYRTAYNQPIILCSIGSSGIIGAQIIAGFINYDWGFYIQIGDISNLQNSVKVSFMYIES